MPLHAGPRFSIKTAAARHSRTLTAAATHTWTKSCGLAPCALPATVQRYRITRAREASIERVFGLARISRLKRMEMCIWGTAGCCVEMREAHRYHAGQGASFGQSAHSLRCY
jgi:hypothetical protein